MSADTCPLCGTSEAWDGDWPCCGCDRNLGLTLTVRETAAYLGVSRGNVYDLVNTGYLAAIRTRRPMRIRMTAIKDYLAGSTPGGGGTTGATSHPACGACRDPPGAGSHPRATAA
jgi:excisionase family DNA binding protein